MCGRRLVSLLLQAGPQITKDSGTHRSASDTPSLPPAFQPAQQHELRSWFAYPIRRGGGKLALRTNQSQGFGTGRSPSIVGALARRLEGGVGQLMRFGFLLRGKLLLQCAHELLCFGMAVGRGQRNPFASFH